jgi:glycosyltransferase involved in cell wall biosynthesis
MNDSLDNLFDDLLIVMVIYEQPLSSSKAWVSLVSELPHKASVFLFENSVESQQVPPSMHDVYYQFNSGNAGVAKAYNAGWQKAKQLGKQWILLLDQDTEISAKLFDGYIDSMRENSTINMFAPILTDNLGVVSPFYFKKGISKRLKKVTAGVVSFENRRSVNSGTLIKTIVFDHVDGFDERLPLDHSDIYFQEKVSQHFSSFAVVPCELNHQFSGSDKQGIKVELSRYKTFCASCNTMTSLKGNKINYYITSLKRAIRLSVKHFSATFLFIHFQTWGKT